MIGDDDRAEQPVRSPLERELADAYRRHDKTRASRQRVKMAAARVRRELGGNKRFTPKKGALG